MPDTSALTKVNLQEKLSAFTDHWSPRIVASYNDNDIMVVRVEGEFVWHSHPDTDDFFELRDRTITLGPGELFVVPTGIEHRPVARRGEVKVLLIEPRGTPNTGDEATAAHKVAI